MRKLKRGKEGLKSCKVSKMGEIKSKRKFDQQLLLGIERLWLKPMPKIVTCPREMKEHGNKIRLLPKEKPHL